MKVHILIFCISYLFLSNNTLLSSEKTPIDETVEIYMPQKIKLGIGMESYSADKAETGMQLAFALSKKALIYPESMLDSVIAKYKDIDPKPNAFALADEIGAHNVLFANISRIENLLRVNLVSIDLDSLSAGFTMKEALATAKKGEGFAYVNYWQENGEPMIDPSLVAATQRAFANMTGDSLIYDGLQEPYEVYPWGNLAIGGVKVIDNSGFTINSELFTNRMTSSFAISESVFDQMTADGPYVVWDIATRDTIMTMEGFYGVENYNTANKKELATLWKAGVDHVVFGNLNRIPKGGEIKLMLGRILAGGEFEKENEIVYTFEGDTIDELIAASKNATKKLLGINEE